MMERHETARDARETARLEAFSDGVFAIAITLLVLDLHVPHGMPAAGALARALAGQWPAYAAFLISFATIGIMWINHHRLFTVIGHVDHALLVLNSLLLLGVIFVPFPTALIAEYVGHPGETVAAAVYSGTFTVIAVVFNVLWRYASSGHRLLRREADHGLVRAITRAYTPGPILYGASFALAFVNVMMSLALTMGLALFFALPSRPHTGGD